MSTKQLKFTRRCFSNLVGLKLACNDLKRARQYILKKKEKGDIINKLIQFNVVMFIKPCLTIQGCLKQGFWMAKIPWIHNESLSYISKVPRDLK
jgi:hypothetical protein